MQAETRLAGAPGARERQKPGSRQELFGLPDLIVAADEARQLGGKVVGDGLERLERWKLGGQALHAELEKTLGPGHVLEPMEAQVFQRQPRRQCVLDERPGGLRNQDLAAVAGARHASRPMDVEAQVLVADERRLAGVQTDADPNLSVLRPGVLR